MTVTFVSPFAQPAGSERYLGVVLEGLPREQVRDVVFLQDGPFADEVRARGFPVEVWPTGPGVRSILRAARRLRRHLRRAAPDLVHANGIKAALVAVLATLGTRTPVVWVKHDLSFDRSLARPVALGCRLVVGVSEAAVRVFRSRRKVRVVPNALPRREVDRQAGRRLVLAALGVDDSAAVVALVGRLYPMKGQHELLEATPELRARVQRVRIALVGAADPNEPEYAARLRTRAAELGDSVSFVGEVEDAAHFVAGCDAVAIPSVPAERGNTESFSLVALEAMAAGTPVAAYAEGGLPEVLGECALLVPTGDRSGLADSLARLFEDETLRERLAACGRERAATQFSVDRMLESLRACYREALRDY
jgi:glycosyltransferase involved in cell wall biosynthesis